MKIAIFVYDDYTIATLREGKSVEEYERAKQILSGMGESKYKIPEASYELDVD